MPPAVTTPRRGSWPPEEQADGKPDRPTVDRVSKTASSIGEHAKVLVDGKKTASVTTWTTRSGGATVFMAGDTVTFSGGGDLGGGTRSITTVAGTTLGGTSATAA